jgi:hypothetical protein
MTADKHTGPLRAAVWRAARRAAAALKHVHDEQTLMWELQWQSSRAAVPETSPLTWVPTLDGPRLAGSHLPVPDDTTAGGIR